VHFHESADSVELTVRSNVVSNVESQYRATLRSNADDDDDDRPPEAMAAMRAQGSSARKPGTVRKVLSDVSKIPIAVEPLEQFDFLRAEAREVHGLQKWSAEQWGQRLRANPAAARELTTALRLKVLSSLATADDEEAETDEYWRECGDLVSRKLRRPMSMAQWKEVVRFQNELLNQPHSEDAEAAQSFASGGSSTQAYDYMSPYLLSNMSAPHSARQECGH